jgi:hypothetical protein
MGLHRINEGEAMLMQGCHILLNIALHSVNQHRLPGVLATEEISKRTAVWLKKLLKDHDGSPENDTCLEQKGCQCFIKDLILLKSYG